MNDSEAETKHRNISMFNHNRIGDVFIALSPFLNGWGLFTILLVTLFLAIYWWQHPHNFFDLVFNAVNTVAGFLNILMWLLVASLGGFILNKTLRGLIEIIVAIKALFKAPPQVHAFNENFALYSGKHIQIHDHKEDKTVYNYKISELPQSKDMPQLLAPPPVDLHVPTFAESLRAGDIGPDQRELLFCHELVRDEYSSKVTAIEPRFCEIGDASTLLLAGASKSGKTTYMTNISLQQAFMSSVFFAIDPHRQHPEKSLTAKLQPLIEHGYFVLPPAYTNAEVHQVLRALQVEGEARLNGKTTRLSGLNIVVLIDEVVALMARQRQTQNKEVQAMYGELGVFMRRLGVEFNKWEMNGVFGTQYVTKEELGDAEWRDACTGQGVLRLPAVQAQALRLLDKEDLRATPQLPTGHGFMVFAGDTVPIRMASGDTTMADIIQVARMLPPSPIHNTHNFRGFSPTIVEPVETNETNEQPTSNLSGNQRETPLEADLEKKLQKVLQLEAEGKIGPDIMREVWNVSNGGSERYKEARAEFQVIKRIIAERMGVLQSQTTREVGE